ncbi:crotonase/enoyl-CoA hydratase family protein [uncultured Reyranella sp.]|uniref:crotonase/enoyl-CoA hydratase family protein n=1 Tax=uncultured Reyranella sp. TaxID=735512 RepID=UPI0025ECC38D|nr:crotonase/enoyl-CoA hydratase family protein [uncultured Reyranella sp.]
MLTSVTFEDGVTRILLDDGKVNAMSLEMLTEIATRLEEAASHGGPVVVQGRPGIFSAGFDLRTFARGPDASLAMVRAGADLILRFLKHPRPIVTVCTGHAYPMGAFLMLAADVRFGVAGNWKIGLNEVAIGLTVPHFALALARHRLSPPGLARVSTATMFEPVSAQQHGYLDQVCEAADLQPAIEAELQRLKALDWPSYEATKKRLNDRIADEITAAIQEYRPGRAAA